MSKRSKKSDRWVGQSMIRVDGDGKVRGRTQYLNDIPYKGSGKASWCAPVAHGILKAVTLGPGVRLGQVVWRRQGTSRRKYRPHDRTMPLLPPWAVVSIAATGRGGGGPHLAVAQGPRGNPSRRMSCRPC